MSISPPGQPPEPAAIREIRADRQWFIDRGKTVVEWPSEEAELLRAWDELTARLQSVEEALRWYADEAQWEDDSDSEFGPFWYFGQGTNREIPWKIAQDALTPRSTKERETG